MIKPIPAWGFPVQAVGTNSSIVIGGTNNNTLTKTAIQEAIPEVSESFEVKVMPNPTNTNFTLTVQSGNSKDIIKMQMADMYGRIIETRTLSASQTISIGDNYRPGTYFVRVMQGVQHRELKLIKLSN